MSQLLDPTNARFAAIENRLTSIEDRLHALERDMARVLARLDAMPTVWQLVFMFAPLYAVMILGFAGLILAMLNTRPAG